MIIEKTLWYPEKLSSLDVISEYELINFQIYQNIKMIFYKLSWHDNEIQKYKKLGYFNEMRFHVRL